MYLKLTKNHFADLVTNHGDNFTYEGAKKLYDILINEETNLGVEYAFDMGMINEHFGEYSPDDAAEELGDLEEMEEDGGVLKTEHFYEACLYPIDCSDNFIVYFNH